ncbi:MAG: Ig-like domain-containing protein, partial [Parcubacteria group bacterium]|nr:Ig-like domain-containing protein [Parcubacteria group bacterium]
MTTMSGGEVHSTADGTSWSEIEVEDSNNTEITPMIVYGKKLYTGASDTINGGKLLETSNGTSWTQVNTNGFGDSNNGYIVSAGIFNYKLYVGINNSTDGTEIWSAQVSDSTGPSFSSQSPSNGTVDVSRDTNISFNINDSIWEIDQDSINVTIEGGAAISAGSCQTGYSCIIEDDGSDGYDVTINPGSDFGYSQTVNITASASDGPGNSTSTSWSFTTEAESINDEDEDDDDDSSSSDGDSSPTGGVYRERSGTLVDLNPKILTTSGPGEVTRLWVYDRRGDATDVKIEEDLFPSSYTGGAGIVAIDQSNNYVRDQYLFFATSNGGPQARVMGLRSDGSTVLKGQQFVFQAPGDAVGTSSIRDGLSATVGDFDNDGFQDDAAFCLTGDYTPHVKVFKDATGIDDWELLNQFTIPIGPTGCNLGTFQYDTGAPELLITPHHGPTTPNVYIYTVGGTLKKQFPAYDDPIDQGLTASSVNDRIYTTPNNGSSHVRAFDRDGDPKNFWWVYQQHVRGDFTVRAGDIDLDNKDELIISPVGANGPHVVAFESTNKWRTWPNFFAFGDETLRNGVGIAVIENWHGVN